MRHIYLFFFLALFSLLILQTPARASNNELYSSSGLPIPRFVTLAEDDINVRAGPGKKYPIQWVLKRKGLPVEVILEFDNWRKIRDIEGNEGWVFHTLLSGVRAGIITNDEPVIAYDAPYKENEVKTRAKLRFEPSVIVKIEHCRERWCTVKSGDLSGWVERKFLWGVYETENID